MGRRYERTFECEDCGIVVTRKWQIGRPLICIDCAKTRLVIATEAAHRAVEEHKAACRLELAARRVMRESEARRVAKAGARICV